MAVTDNSSDGFTKVETASDNDDEEAEWLDLESGDSVEGEVREVKENCGDYDSRVYKISRGPGDTVLLWGKASLDEQFDSEELGAGSVVRFVNTGEEYETNAGNTGVRYEVFYK